MPSGVRLHAWRDTRAGGAILLASVLLIFSRFVNSNEPVDAADCR